MENKTLSPQEALRALAEGNYDRTKNVGKGGGMSDYPTLSEKGEREFDSVIQHAKKRLLKACEESLSELYIELGEYIETDSWTNFRNQFVAAFMRLDENFCGRYDLRKMAFKIAETYPEKLAGLINEENVVKIERLEKWLSEINAVRSNY